MGDQPQSHDSERVGILLKQYEICAMHHLGFYSLIWQVPSVAVVIAGGLASVVFSSDMPGIVRIPMLLVGTTLIMAMTVAFERFRMFQFRRRKDMEELETELEASGARRLSWAGGEIVRQIRSGELPVQGIPFYHVEGFQLLRALMYFMTGALIVITLLSIAAAYGLGPLVGA